MGSARRGVEPTARIEARTNRFRRIRSSGQAVMLSGVRESNHEAKTQNMHFVAALFLSSADRGKIFTFSLEKGFHLVTLRWFRADRNHEGGSNGTYLMKYQWWFAVDWCSRAMARQLRVEMWVGEIREQW